MSRPEWCTGFLQRSRLKVATLDGPSFLVEEQGYLVVLVVPEFVLGMARKPAVLVFGGLVATTGASVG